MRKAGREVEYSQDAYEVQWILQLLYQELDDIEYAEWSRGHMSIILMGGPVSYRCDATGNTMQDAIACMMISVDLYVYHDAANVDLSRTLAPIL